MADSYSGGRYSSGAASNGRERSGGLRFPMWSSSDASDGSLDRWNNSSTVLTQYEVRRDHVCKPVIIGSDGKAMPAVFECPPNHNHAMDDGAAVGYGRSWADTPAGGGDMYAYKSDPYKQQAFIGGDSAGRFGLGAGGSALHRPKADMYGYQYEEEDDDRYENGYGSRVETGRSWQAHHKSTEPKWGTGGKFGGGSGTPARAAVGWGGDGKLSRATNVIDKAVEFLWDASPRPAGGMGRTDPWGGAQPPASTYQPARRSSAGSGLIDSREAVKKYGGQFIW